MPAAPPLSHPPRWSDFLSVPNLLFLLLIPIGLVLFYTLFLTPTQNVLRARSWLPTPCTILSSSVRTHRNSKSTTYSPEIEYRYEFDHTTYTGTRFTFASSFSTSSYDSVVKNLKAYPRGVRTACYVDPNDPSQSVLLRNFTPSFLLGLTPLLFTLAGSFGLVAQLGTALHARRPISADTPAPRRLHSNHQPLSNFLSFFLATALFLLVFCVFFNDCLAGWQNHFPNIPLTFALFPFALFTLGFIFATAACFISLVRNPRITLALSAEPLTPSVPAALTYCLSPCFSSLRPKSSVRNIRRLRIDLVGYIDTATSTTAEFFKSPFTRVSLLDTTDPAQFPAGSLPFTPPLGPASLFLPQNRIRWTFNLLADLSDDSNPLDLSYLVHLLPPPPASSHPTGPPLSSSNASPTNTSLEIPCQAQGSSPGRSSSPQTFTLSLPHATYPRTSTLTGTVSTSSPTPGPMHLALLLHTTGRGVPNSHTVSHLQIPADSPFPYPFSFPLPESLPPTYTHDLLSLHYSLELSTPTTSTRLECHVV